MFAGILKLIFKDHNSKFLKSSNGIIESINSLEGSISPLNDDELRSKSLELRNQVQSGRSVDDALPEAFAMVRESAKRTLGTRHFDVQLIGGLALHRGYIAQMRTGEGKTLTCTAPAYLNALLGHGVHVVSVNDYLTHRDAEWMRPVYEKLGLSVGCVIDSTDSLSKIAAYKSDVTYVNNSTLGFDYLRDNMKAFGEPTLLVDRGFQYAIVDEVDSILIDEARTPLIISGPSVNNAEVYKLISVAVKKLSQEDYVVSEEDKSIYLLDKGVDIMEKELNRLGIISGQLYDTKNFATVNHVNQSLKAYYLFQKNKDYLVKDGKVYIIDEFTGRILDGRRYSDGLHQAIEAKEGVAVQNENQTLASVTYQNLFRMYKKLSGMTGTASTEAEEFEHIYHIKVIDVPTNKPVQRQDKEDLVFLTKNDKNQKILDAVLEAKSIGQPVLVGTASVEYSEELSKLFAKHKIEHQVLNAKNHEKEAKIIANAGRSGTVTISTNMAGRGTDIVLGGNPKILAESEAEKRKIGIDEILGDMLKICEEDKAKVIQAGGLFVLGAERYESRRVDDQLRGRSGRQGDPGKTQFMLSLEDDLLRIFGGDRIRNIVSRLGFKAGESMDHPMLTKVIRYSQKRIEAMNYDVRKNLLRYDDVLNQQRIYIYDKRSHLNSHGGNWQPLLEQYVSDFVQYLSEEFSVGEASVIDNANAKEKIIEVMGNTYFDKVRQNILGKTTNTDVVNAIVDVCCQKLRSEADKHGNDVINSVFGSIALSAFDEMWRIHLSSMTSLRDGIHLRSYGQKDPLSEYKLESYKSFEKIMYLANSLIINRILSFYFEDSAVV